VIHQSEASIGWFGIEPIIIRLSKGGELSSHSTLPLLHCQSPVIYLLFEMTSSQSRSLSSTPVSTSAGTEIPVRSVESASPFLAPRTPDPDLRWYDGEQYRRVLLSRSKRPKRGWWWSYGKEWESVRESENDPYWSCDLCKGFKLYRATSSHHICKHLKDQHKRTDLSDPAILNKPAFSISDLLASGGEIPRSLSHRDKETLRGELVNKRLIDWITHDHVAFRQVESERFRLFLESLHEEHVKHVPLSHNTIRERIINEWELQKSQIKQKLKLSQSEVHLSFDLWTTSQRTKSVLGIVAHYLGPDWINHVHLLALRHLDGSHSGENMAAVVLDVIQQYEIDSVGFFILDNASSNDTAVKHILASLKTDFGLEEYCYRRLRCLGHIINLAAQAFLFGQNVEAFENDDWDDLETAYKLWKTAGPVALVKYLMVFIRGSDQRRQTFKRFQESEVTLQALNNNKTRWNSTYNMLRRALLLREAINLFCIQYIRLGELETEAMIDDETWSLLQRICDILEVFNIATLQFQGKGQDGHHGALWEVLPSIEQMLTEMESFRAQYPLLEPQDLPTVSRGRKPLSSAIVKPSNEQFLAIAVNNAWKKLDEYYDLTDQSTAYIAAVVLNPQWKWIFFDASWASRQDWLTTAKTKVQNLWDEYQDRYAVPEAPSVPIVNKPTYTRPQPQLAYMYRITASQSTSSIPKGDDYERYMKDDPVHVAEGVVFSQLTWWKDNSWKYPLLAKLAMNLLSAPAMSTEIERVFSSTGITDSDLRNQLLMRAMEASECLRHSSKNH
jgi:hypothetical protein